MEGVSNSEASEGASVEVVEAPGNLLQSFRQAAGGPLAALRRHTAVSLYDKACSLSPEDQSSLRDLLSGAVWHAEEEPSTSATEGEPRAKRRRVEHKELDPAEGPEEQVEEWLPLMLAGALPALKGALPKDHRGLSVLPHPHPLKKKTMRNARCFLRPSGGLVYDTKRACDNCDKPIEERTWYACAAGCEVDFCVRCHQRYEQLFSGRDPSAALRAADVVTRMAADAMASGAKSRRELVEIFAFQWPHHMFQDLVRAVADVADAKLVHVEDGHNMDLSADLSFWRIVGFLQLLRCANERPSQETRFGELTPRGPRLPEGDFVLGGIDKCDAEAEYLRWRGSGNSSFKASAAVLEDEPFQVTASFALFLAHVDLVPLGFRQRCLHADMVDMVSRARLFRRRVQPLAVRVPRSPKADLCAAAVRQLSEAAGPRLLLAKFSGERGSGPGVTKEFLVLAAEAVLAAKTGEGYKEGPPAWEYDQDSRTYWFSDSATSVPELFRTAGVLLAQALLIGTQVQISLPPLFYSLLLRELGANVPSLGLADLAALKPSLAKGLQDLIDYEDSDVAEVFPLDWPRSDELTTTNRAEYVKDYVQWFMEERYQAQMAPLAKAFSGVLGRSYFLKSQVSATQLEQILCGFEEPMDVDIVRQSTVMTDFTKEEEDRFWSVLGAFDAPQRRAFAVFVSACARRPPEGWQRLELKVQRNGDGDDRLPTAFTCFKLLLLPRYSSAEVLKSRLLAAITETEGFGLS